MMQSLFSAWLFAESSPDDSRGGTSETQTHGRRAVSKRAVVAPRQAFEVAPELVSRICEGDVSAFDALVQQAFEPLVRFAYSLVRTQDAAEDVVQDVFVRVWQLGERWRPAGSGAAYLLTAVRNEALKILRHRQVKIKHEAYVQNDWVPDETTGRLLGPDELLIWREQMRMFEAVLDSLTERQRTAFILRYEQGLTVPAIASVLRVSIKGAEKLVSRVTHLLRERLREIR